MGRTVRLPLTADFDLCEPNLFKANEKTKTVPYTFIIRKNISTIFLQQNSTRTILVRDNQIARLNYDNVKTEPVRKQTVVSESESKIQDTDVGPSQSSKIMLI